MGCAACNSKRSREHDLLARIIDYTRRDDPSYLEQLIKSYSQTSKLNLSQLIDQSIIPVNNYLFNILAFSVWEGRPNVFAFLITRLHASVQRMEENFHCYKIIPLNLICQKGFVGILKAYLPIYMKTTAQKNPNRPTASFSIDYIAEALESPTLAIQEACAKGHIAIIHCVYSFFAGSSPPPVLDVNSVDESTGENCALISVRIGNFVMMKMLHETLQANFHLKNKREEGALQVLARAAKEKCSLEYFECAVYLVEVVRIDVTYRYEETLGMVENGILAKYLTAKLKAAGINVGKKVDCMKSVLEKKSWMDEDGIEVIKGDVSSIILDSDTSCFADSMHLE